jgi:hypothetical protein
MALADRALPYGLRDVKLIELNATGTAEVGAPVDLPVSRTLSFSESEESQELRGDDSVVSTRGSGPTMDWDLEAGGIKLEAYRIMAGGTIVTTGSSPNLKKTYTKKTTDGRPYFKIRGRAINDNGGDLHAIIYRAKVEGTIEGSMGDQEFWITSCSGRGFGSFEASHLDKVYEWVHNETAEEISTSVNEIQVLLVDATGGTYTLTYSGQTTAAIAYDAAASAVQSALEALSNLAPGDVAVSQEAAGQPYVIEFGGTLANTNVTQITTTDTALTGSSSSAGVYTAQNGGGV